MKTLLILSVSANIPLALFIMIVIVILLAAIIVFSQIKFSKKKRRELLEQIKTLEHEREAKILETYGAMKAKDREIKRLADLYLEAETENARLEIAKKNLLGEIGRLTNELQKQ